MRKQCTISKCLGKAAAVIVLSLLLVASPSAVRADGLPDGVRESLLAGNWEDVFQGLKDVALEEADAPSRLVAVHASLETNRNNRALLLSWLIRPGDVERWAEWTGNLGGANPSSAVACYLRGDALARSGDLKEAEKWFTRALELKPKFGLAWVGRGAVRAMSSRDEKDSDRAYMDFFEATDAQPELAEAHAALGCVEIVARNAQGALDAFNEALRCNPDFALAYNGRGCAYYGKGKPDQAVEDFRKAAELFPALAVTTAMNRTFIEGMVLRKVAENFKGKQKAGTTLRTRSELLPSESAAPSSDLQSVLERAGQPGFDIGAELSALGQKRNALTDRILEINSSVAEHGDAADRWANASYSAEWGDQFVNVATVLATGGAGGLVAAGDQAMVLAGKEVLSSAADLLPDGAAGPSKVTLGGIGFNVITNEAELDPLGFGIAAFQEVADVMVDRHHDAQADQVQESIGLLERKLGLDEQYNALYNRWMVEQLIQNPPAEQPTDVPDSQSLPDATSIMPSTPWEQMPNVARNLAEQAGEHGSVVLVGDTPQAWAMEQMLNDYDHGVNDVIATRLPSANEAQLAALGQSDALAGFGPNVEAFQPSPTATPLDGPAALARQQLRDLVTYQSAIEPTQQFSETPLAGGPASEGGSLGGSALHPSPLEKYDSLQYLPGAGGGPEMSPSVEAFRANWDWGTPYTPSGDSGGADLNMDWGFVDKGNWPVTTFFTLVYKVAPPAQQDAEAQDKE